MFGIGIFRTRTQMWREPGKFPKLASLEIGSRTSGTIFKRVFSSPLGSDRFAPSVPLRRQSYPAPHARFRSQLISGKELWQIHAAQLESAALPRTRSLHEANDWVNRQISMNMHLLNTARGQDPQAVTALEAHLAFLCAHIKPRPRIAPRPALPLRQPMQRRPSTLDVNEWNLQSGLLLSTSSHDVNLLSGVQRRLQKTERLIQVAEQHPHPALPRNALHELRQYRSRLRLQERTMIENDPLDIYNA